MPSLADVLKIFHLSPRFFFAIWVLGMIVLFMPQELGDTFGITSLRNTYREWIGITTLAAFILWALQLWPLFQEWIWERKWRSELKHSISTLSPQERLVLAYCLDRNRQTIALGATHPVTQSLYGKGFLRYPSTTIFLENLTISYIIPHFVWKELQKYKDKILPEEERQKPEVRALLDQFEENQLRIR